MCMRQQKFFCSKWKKYMSCFLEWLMSLLFHLPAVGCLIQSNAISDLSSVSITISRISGKISVWEGTAVASFKASPWQRVLLRVHSWDLEREEPVTNPGTIRSLWSLICVQLPKAHTLEACSEASHNQQAVHIVLDWIHERVGGCCFPMHVKHLPFSLSRQTVPGLCIKKIPFKAQRWPECRLLFWGEFHWFKQYLSPQLSPEFFMTVSGEMYLL